MKKIFVKALSVCLAMITLLVTSMLPVSAATTNSYHEEVCDSYGNRVYAAMSVAYTVGTSKTTLDDVTTGGYLYTSTTLPYHSKVYVQSIAGATYKGSDTLFYHKGTLEVNRLVSNKYYRVATSPTYGSSIYPFDQNKTLQFIHGYTRVASTDHPDLSVCVNGLNSQIVKYYTEVLFEE